MLETVVVTVLATVVGLPILLVLIVFGVMVSTYQGRLELRKTRLEGQRHTFTTPESKAIIDREIQNTNQKIEAEKKRKTIERDKKRLKKLTKKDNEDD